MTYKISNNKIGNVGNSPSGAYTPTGTDPVPAFKVQWGPTTSDAQVASIDAMQSLVMDLIPGMIMLDEMFRVAYKISRETKDDIETEDYVAPWYIETAYSVAFYDQVIADLADKHPMCRHIKWTFALNVVDGVMVAAPQDQFSSTVINLVVDIMAEIESDEQEQHNT